MVLELYGLCSVALEPLLNKRYQNYGNKEEYLKNTAQYHHYCIYLTDSVQGIYIAVTKGGHGLDGPVEGSHDIVICTTEIVAKKNETRAVCNGYIQKKLSNRRGWRSALPSTCFCKGKQISFVNLVLTGY